MRPNGEGRWAAEHTGPDLRREARPADTNTSVTRAGSHRAPPLTDTEEAAPPGSPPAAGRHSWRSRGSSAHCSAVRAPLPSNQSYDKPKGSAAFACSETNP